MTWLLKVDVGLFRWINEAWSNAFFDWLMPILSGNRLFVPLLLVLVVWAMVKGARRIRVCIVMVAIAAGIGDGLVSNTIKKAVERPRPFMELDNVQLRVGRGGSGSMPSSHAANWFAGAMVAFLFYRKSWRFMVPMASAVAVSRVYNGVHYPSDVVAGAILGAGTAVASSWSAAAVWAWLGRKGWNPWFSRMPDLLEPERTLDAPGAVAAPMSDAVWRRFAFLIIFALLGIRLWYLSAGKIELSEDEAYQWLWSKHPALSYFSKPLLIAVAQMIGTGLWGDTAFGVRFLSPVIAALISVVIFRFIDRQAGPKTGLAAVLIVSSTPLMAVGATLMTIDPLSVLFWCLAMFAGWKAIQPDGNASSGTGEQQLTFGRKSGGTTYDWLQVGLWSGLGLLSKYTNLLQLVGWVLVFALWKPSRIHLRRPGPWLALGMVLLASLPIVIWNSQHDWITAKHVASDGRLGEPWKPTLKYLGEFVGAELGLLNPVFFVGMIFAAIVGVRSFQEKPLWRYLFLMGAPVFGLYLALSFHSRVLPNWIAPGVLPWFCLMILFWNHRWPVVRRWARPVFFGGAFFGLFVVVVLHDTNLIAKLSGRTLPAKLDPLRRVRGWSDTAAVIGSEWRRLRTNDARAFIIGDHYGICGQVAFYLPEAKRDPKNDPKVFFIATGQPDNQFHFWKNYLDRKGASAIYIQQLEDHRPEKGWFVDWITGDEIEYRPVANSQPPNEIVVKQFAEVKSLGVREVVYRGNVVRRFELFECRGLK